MKFLKQLVFLGGGGCLGPPSVAFMIEIGSASFEG